MSDPWDNLKDAPKTSSQTKTPNSFAQPIVSQPISGQPITSQSNVQQPIGNATAPSEAAFSSPPIAAKPSVDRKGAIIFLLGGVALTAFDWWMLNTQHQYYVKAAVLGPLAIVGGVMGLIFPQIYNDKSPRGQNKILSFVTFAIGLAAGGLNWYLMAN